MILDATAGNRTMWKVKDAEGIIYIDMERRLMNKPTIFADNNTTPFLDKAFDTIFYDPPHKWGGTSGAAKMSHTRCIQVKLRSGSRHMSHSPSHTTAGISIKQELHSFATSTLQLRSFTAS